jgi:hypothetical protein
MWLLTALLRIDSDETFLLSFAFMNGHERAMNCDLNDSGVKACAPCAGPAPLCLSGYTLLAAAVTAAAAFGEARLSAFQSWSPIVASTGWRAGIASPSVTVDSLLGPIIEAFVGDRERNPADAANDGCAPPKKP